MLNCGMWYYYDREYVRIHVCDIWGTDFNAHIWGRICDDSMSIIMALKL